MGRNELAKLFCELGFKYGAEIGVEKGHYSKVLCENNPGVHLVCVDAWTTYKGYRDYTDQQKFEDWYGQTKMTLAPYHTTILRKFSQDAVKDFSDGELDFVYIDANHTFRGCTNDIADWSTKVKVGGIISGHDYHRFLDRRNIKVVEVVDGWTKAHKIEPWFITGSKEKIDGQIRDVARSWFWVKQW